MDANASNTGKTEKTIVITMMVAVVIAIIVYSAVIIYMWYQNTGLFSSYVAPDPPTNTYYPRGKVIDLTDEQATRQQCLYKNYLNNDFQASCS